MYYIVALADWPAQVEETSNANNTRASAAVRVGPDLTISAVSVPATAAAGDAMLVGDTTRNQGAGVAPSTITRFYLSSNTAWDAADLPLGERETGPLAAGASSSASITVVVPPSTSIGTYYVLARADAAETLREVAENNNLRSGSVRVGADLQVPTLTAPGQAAAGDSVSVTETTKNSGGAETPESTTDFYLSANTSLDAADVRLGARPVPALNANESSTATVALQLPGLTAAGTVLRPGESRWAGHRGGNERDQQREGERSTEGGARTHRPDRHGAGRG